MSKFMGVVGAMLIVGAGVGPAAYAESSESEMDRLAPPAFQTIAGTLEQIDGNVYVVAEYITNYRGEEIKDKETNVVVNNDTKLVNGLKSVGDAVRIEVRSSGLANSIE